MDRIRVGRLELGRRAKYYRLTPSGGQQLVGRKARVGTHVHGHRPGDQTGVSGNLQSTIHCRFRCEGLLDTKDCLDAVGVADGGAGRGISLTIGWRPFLGPSSRPLTERRFERTPERVARGQYLAENLLNCFACHSDREWTKHDAPVIAGTHGAGSPAFALLDLPGEVRPPNISPDPETGAGNWTDDQLARAIREGIGFDGRALFPFMPYENFRSLSDEDLASVIVYLRSMPPVRRAVARTELDVSG